MSARRLMQALLLLQAIAAGAIALALLRSSALATPSALALGVGAVLLVRILITANNFVLSARLRGPAAPRFPLSPRAFARMLAREFQATMLYSSWYMPRASAGSELFADSVAPPVLLLHGYFCNSGYWAHLAPQLSAARISYASLDLEPLLGGIDDYVPMIASAIRTLGQDSGAARVVIVGHSMGGLAARAYLRAHGAARVARVVTLGTPHHGTGLAQFGPGLNARQMRRTRGHRASASTWLQTLAASETAATRSLFTSIYTQHDNIVSPASSSVLADAVNVAFSGVGHVALARDAAVLARVIAEVRAASVTALNASPVAAACSTSATVASPASGAVSDPEAGATADATAAATAHAKAGPVAAAIAGEVPDLVVDAASATAVGATARTA
jgi:pimeloyl-ACP methyl ester carboxylesterase